MNRRIIVTALFALFAFIFVVAPAAAQEVAAESDDVGLRVDVEVDPLAFIASGHSLHVGVGWSRYRFDVGAFAMDMPDFVHGQADFDTGFSGFGAKFDVFWFEDQSGPFASLELGWMDTWIRDEKSGQSIDDGRFGIGTRIGWRFMLPADLFITPWVGVSYSPGVDDVEVGGRTFEQSAFGFFPTVHLGYRFM